MTLSANPHQPWGWQELKEKNSFFLLPQMLPSHFQQAKSYFGLGKCSLLPTNVLI